MKGDKESNGLIENAVMLIRGIIRTIKCHIESRTQEPLSDDSPVMPWLVEHAGCILSRCPKGRDGRTPFERLHGKKPTQEFVPFGEKGAGKTSHHRTDEQDEPQISVRSLAWDAQQQRRMFHSGMQMVCSELAISEDWSLRTDGTQRPSTVCLECRGD